MKSLVSSALIAALCFSQAGALTIESPWTTNSPENVQINTGRRLEGFFNDHGIPQSHPGLHRLGKSLEKVGLAEDALGLGAAAYGAATNNKQLEDGGVALAGTGLATAGGGHWLKKKTKGPKPGVFYGRKLEGFFSDHGIPIKHPGLHRAGKALEKVGLAEDALGLGAAAYGAATNNKQLEDGGVALAGTGLATGTGGHILKKKTRGPKPGVLYGRKLQGSNHGIPQSHPKAHKLGKALEKVGVAEDALGVGAAAYGAATNNKQLENNGVALAGAGLATGTGGHVLKKATRGPKPGVLYGRKLMIKGEEENPISDTLHFIGLD